MAGTYVKIPPDSSGGDSSSTISNVSTVPGETVTSALDNLKTDVDNVTILAQETQYVPLPIFTLTNTDITNKFVDMGAIPSDPTATQLFIIGGSAAAYGTDYTVIGSHIDWSGLSLDGLLSTGDKLVIAHN